MLTWRENFYEQKKGQQFTDNIIDSNFSNILLMNWAHELFFVSALLEGVLKEEFKMTQIYLVFFPPSSHLEKIIQGVFIPVPLSFIKVRHASQPWFGLNATYFIKPDVLTILSFDSPFKSLLSLTVREVVVLIQFHWVHNRSCSSFVPIQASVSSTANYAGSPFHWSDNNLKHTHHNCPNNLTNCKLS